jgi:hypothetical protein
MSGNQREELPENMPLEKRRAAYRQRAREEFFEASATTDPLDVDMHMLSARGWLIMAYQVDITTGL